MSTKQLSKPLRLTLWIAQTLIFVAFIAFGCIKLFMPVAQLAAMWQWPGEVPVGFLRSIGVIDVLGGAGVLLPRLTGIHPRLSVWAAAGCILLQLAAMVFHTWRGETAALPLNVVLLALMCYIYWGLTRTLRQSS